MNTDFNYKLLPSYGLRGEQLDDKVDFFALSEKIGDVMYGYSNFFKNSPLKYKNENSFWNFFKSYKYQNILIGTKGFAFFTIKNYLDNFIDKDEIIFDECTDLYVMHTEQIKNFVYHGTDVNICFMNRNTNKMIFQKIGWYNKEYDDFENEIYYNLPKCLEEVWSLHLLNRLKYDISKKGYISFYVHNDEDKIYEYIQIYEDKIIFLREKTIIYNREDIKSIYTKGNELVVEHNNFKKGIMGFNSGNINKVPLNKLLNRKFFFIVLNKIFGYA